MIVYHGNIKVREFARVVLLYICSMAQPRPTGRTLICDDDIYAVISHEVQMQKAEQFDQLGKYIRGVIAKARKNGMALSLGKGYFDMTPWYFRERYTDVDFLIDSCRMFKDQDNIDFWLARKAEYERMIGEYPAWPVVHRNRKPQAEQAEAE